MKKILILTLLSFVLLLSSCAVNKITSPDTDTKAQTETTAVTMADTVSDNVEIVETSDEAQTSADTTVNYAISGVGGTSQCLVHHTSYHMIPGELINFVGIEEYEAWRETLTIDDTKLGTETECPFQFSIKALINEFDISKQDFTSIVSPLRYGEYSTEILYSRTDAEIDSYFKNIEELNKWSYREDHYFRLSDFIRTDYADELEKITGNYGRTCVPELVQTLSINRNELEEYISKATKDCIDQDGQCYTFDYDLDMLYGSDQMQAGQMSLTPQADVLSVNNDADPTNDISSNDLDEMFCRIGDYAE